MDKNYNHQNVEDKIYKEWEEKGYFKPEINPKGKSYSILLPPPNANDPLHMGHAMYVVEDILIRYHRMLGDACLFLPGTDHAGIETQYVFEKKLAQEGKSRFDFDRETLFRMISDYVEKNRGIAKNQLKKLGFSLDWSREKYTMDPKILETVFNTFIKLYKEGLIYRDEKLINYCTFCGTGFSDLEVKYVEKNDSLYFLDYGPIQISTTRPETIFADVAVAVNPNDKRYKDLIGKEAIVPIINKKIPIIADELVEMEFGTGALKITPSHDPTDYEIGQRHKLPRISVIGFDGKMINVPKEIEGLYAKQARKKTVELLGDKLIKEEPLTHNVGACYRCSNVLEPLTLPQWFVKIQPLAKPAIDVVEKGELKIFPPRFEKAYLDWMKNIRDWNISRQIVWGPQIPVWYEVENDRQIYVWFLDKKGEFKKGTVGQLLEEGVAKEEIESGLQRIFALPKVKYVLEEEKEKDKWYLPETDTFDTWFSSGQWPLTTLGYPDSPDFKKFYPTSVLDTMWDILPFWVARMIMFGLYLTGDVPFKVAHMHSRVIDIKRQKMSKSKGNVIDPINMVDKYGADALRVALVFGTAPASDVAIAEDKIKSMRNFSNKLWNMGRFIEMKRVQVSENNLTIEQLNNIAINANDKEMIKKTEELVKQVTSYLEKYDFNYAFNSLYEFSWHTFADKYIEDVKNRIDENSYLILNSLFLILLKLLHPFMPFLTEELYQNLSKMVSKVEPHKESIMLESWPKEI